MKYLYSFLIFLVLGIGNSVAQKIEPAILQKEWRANWIAMPQEPATRYGVYYFRKRVELPTKPASFLVHVSADNRYKLFVNGKLVSLGPARGDINHWNYETVDLAPYLQVGKNLIAAQVWNEGEYRMEAQISHRTGFILQGATEAERVVNTDKSWKVIRDESYHPIEVKLTQTYYVAGPGEQIDMSRRVKDWQQVSLNDTAWQNAQTIGPGVPKQILSGYGVVSGWLLVPSGLPQMELTPQRLQQVRKAENIKVPANFPAKKTALTIPANTVATLWLDQGFLTNAYPTLYFSGGKEGTISIRYAESLYTKYPAKGNRNKIEGKIFIGREDSLIADGTKGQTFTALSWRTYRYLQVRVITKAEPLVLEDIYGTFTGYPFRMNAKLDTENTELTKIMDIGWRTARLNAWETYTDCPYYEQLQYIGDTRIQALISLYNSGDDRLLRNALNQMDYSRLPEGVTLSRHPSSSPQLIPTFSLWYIGMLHDYWRYGKDSQFVKDKLPGERQVLQYFSRFQQADGSLKDTPNWMFTDWVTSKGWQSGEAPKGAAGNSSVLDLQLLWAYQTAAELESKLGMQEYAQSYLQKAEQLKTTIRQKYWDDSRKLFADHPEKDLFSQHPNALAILTGLVNKEEAQVIGKQLLTDKGLAPASIYFKYYLHQALVKAGLGNDYLNWLDIWRENIKMGLTTWGETSEVNTTRSDCHAWGASPNIEFFRTILGIDSEAPGFAKVRIEPHLGMLKTIGGEMPHPNGKVQVKYKETKGSLNAEIMLPANTTGQFIWQGKSYPLKEGKNSLKI